MNSTTPKIRYAAAIKPGMETFWSLCLLVSILLVIQGCKKPEEEPKPFSSPGLQLITDNLVSPLSITEAPDGSKRMFIVDQVGKIWVIAKDGSRMPIPFLDISSKMVTLNPNYDERGLLGFAFHPNFKANGRFFVYYTARPRPGGPQPGTNWNNLSRVSEFKVSANRDEADINSEKFILEEDHPQGNHNGGTIAFGPDGYLYISIGDGGGSNDNGIGHVADWYTVNTGGNGQDVYANLMGNILRIDINSGSPYGIPADNPFVSKPGKDEIYAYGFRNPYRFSFDMGGSHQLFAGDAGQVLYEEIDLVKKGGNYGWNVKEGTHCFSTVDNKTELASCPMVDTAGNLLIDPIIEMSNVNNPRGGLATTIVGGNVYRGEELPQLKGQYIFGIFSRSSGVPNGKLFISNPPKSGPWSYTDLALKNYPDNLGVYLKGFGQDQKGEVYITTSGVAGPNGTTGKVFKLANVSVKGS
ncbi:MAG: PQQ-dependent sugar dehydrogenase [Chitinophagaceae bacterium]